MPHLAKISEAASMALHTMAMMAGNPDEALSARSMAEALGCSEAHLAKVLQRLAKAGLLTSTRGPKGGFVLARPAGAITLLEIYETIEGPLTPSQCLLGKPVCGGNCILGGLLGEVDLRAQEYLGNKSLADFSAAFSGGSHDRE
ncbi:MAG: Rrf2 family transcriptional regulator [Thermodesulfobacteriota bacterium]